MVTAKCLIIIRLHFFVSFVHFTFFVIRPFQEQRKAWTDTAEMGRENWGDATLLAVAVIVQHDPHHCPVLRWTMWF